MSLVLGCNGRGRSWAAFLQRYENCCNNDHLKNNVICFEFNCRVTVRTDALIFKKTTLKSTKQRKSHKSLQHFIIVTDNSPNQHQYSLLQNLPVFSRSILSIILLCSHVHHHQLHRDFQQTSSTQYCCSIESYFCAISAMYKNNIHSVYSSSAFSRTVRTSNVVWFISQKLY